MNASPRIISDCESFTHVSEHILRNPGIIDSPLYRYTLIDVIHKYIDTSDFNTQMVYMHYLLGKDFEESAHILNVPESSVHRFFNTFISRFYRFTANQLKKGNIDIEETYRYIRCLQDQKMDDQEVSDSFNENMLTTKVMKHFLKQAHLISQFFMIATTTADTLELISFINFIHILPKHF